jgi:hypothetical protein
MANDNPEKYLKDGGIHIGRMTRDEVIDDGLDPEKAWICFALKEKNNVIVSVVPGEYALGIADAIKKLVDIKL